MKTADEILSEVMDDSPYKSDFTFTRPLVIEAMERYAQQKLQHGVSGKRQIEERINYLAKAEHEELIAIDSLAVSSLERRAKWGLIKEVKKATRIEL